MSLFTNDKQNIFILIFIFIGVVFIVNPIGNFPLNDDWSYAKPVHSLLNGDGIKFTGWMSMTLFSQVIWGAIWCKIFGFSFTILRFSTLFLSGLGVIYTYKLIRVFNANLTHSFAFSLLVLFNPIFLNLSFTFMTDVPFYTLSIIAIYHFTKHLENKLVSHLIFAAIFSVIATLTRQLALIIPLSFFVVGIYDFILTKNIKLKYLIPFIISCIVFLIYQEIAHHFFDARGRYDEMNNKLLSQITASPITWIISVFNRSVIGWLYLTLFISPILLGLIIKSSKKIIFTSVVVGGIFSIFLFSKEYVFPILDNIIYNLGLGPATLYDYWFGDKQGNHQINNYFWLFLTIFVCILFIYLIIKLGGALAKKIMYSQKMIFIGIIFIGYLVLICSIYTYDRYYVLPLTLLLIIISSTLKLKISKYMFSILLFLISAFSVLATKDYLAWNQARWQVAHHLMERKQITSAKIDGGFEFNGWFNYNDDDFNNGLKNLWVHDVDYIIAFEQLSHTEIEFEAHYFSFIWMKNKSIKALRKKPNFTDLKEPYYPKK